MFKRTYTEDLRLSLSFLQLVKLCLCLSQLGILYITLSVVSSRILAELTWPLNIRDAYRGNKDNEIISRIY